MLITHLQTISCIWGEFVVESQALGAEVVASAKTIEVKSA